MSLRERKKARTKTEIQRQALRLFREQGYQATTVEQIAEAAEVAPSTVFRYFATKEDLAVLDDYYSLADATAAALAAQPAELGPVPALRGALRALFDDLSPEERAARYERDVLMVTVPELWAANLGLFAKGREILRDQLAKRAGRDPDDPAVRAVADAMVGIGYGVLFDWAKNPQGDPIAALDRTLGRLADGLAL
ncbi:TetR/AcrR family transcriptional regulator [Amycolatopsis anabasis]|uniref:TetR/AcrR family transcriptional regulator n=1 Tax=Amycolatopsis anabasis TaxID=1840409 RepID=UPI00131EAC20|nr:TetR family transcriptional regulator [Amycolatopsis anabasis]